MRAGRRKFLKRAMDDAASRRVESRDGIIWSIDAGGRCRVKIQGTNELVTAHFPRNQAARPPWLRVGNAVRISHRGGVRGYIEVSGQGRAIPQPIAGSAMPPPGTTKDGIISGMVVAATDPPSNSVTISSGSYRIDGTVYNYSGQHSGYQVMQADSDMVMGVPTVATMGVPTFELPPGPSAGYFRYDIVVIGADRVTDYIVGTQARSNPPMPAVPSHHLLLAFILRIGGETVIINDRIGIAWSVPMITSVAAEVAGSIPWNTPTRSIGITTLDQYGRPISAPATGWNAKVSIVMGTGQICSAFSGCSTSSAVQPMVGTSSYTFTYRRDQSMVEIPPFFFIEVESQPPVYTYVDWLKLLDENGNPIGGA